MFDDDDAPGSLERCSIEWIVLHFKCIPYTDCMRTWTNTNIKEPMHNLVHLTSILYTNSVRNSCTKVQFISHENTSFYFLPIFYHQTRIARFSSEHRWSTWSNIEIEYLDTINSIFNILLKTSWFNNDKFDQFEFLRNIFTTLKFQS